MKYKISYKVENTRYKAKHEAEKTAYEIKKFWANYTTKRNKS